MNKTKINTRIVSAFLAFILLFGSMLASCDTGLTDGEESNSGNESVSLMESDEYTDGLTTEPSVETEPVETVLDFVKSGETEFVVAAPDSSADQFVLDAFTQLSALITRITGLTVRVSHKENDFNEIMIGYFGRPELEALSLEYRSNDYFVGVRGNKLVIYASSEETMAMALKSFEYMLEVKAKADRANISFNSKENISRVYENYLADSLTVSGTPIHDFGIIYNSSGRYSEEYLALRFRDLIDSSIGYRLKVYDDTSLEAASVKNKILIGKTAFSAENVSSGYDYALHINGGNIYMSADSIEGYDKLYYIWNQKILSGGDIVVEDSYSESGNVKDSTDLLKLKNDVSQDVRIVFNNILGNCNNTTHPVIYRTRSVSEMLVSYAPDVLGLQECSPRSRQDICDIADVLGDYGYTEVPAKATNSSKSNYTPLFYNPKTVKLIDYGYDYYDGSFNDSGSKSLTWAVFEVIVTGKRFAAASTHFFYQSDAAAGRVENAKVIAARCKAIYDMYSCPVIMGGDLNTRIDSNAFRTLTSSGLVDIRAIADKSSTIIGHHTYPEFSTSAGYYKTYYVPNGTYTGSIDHALVYGGDTVTFDEYYVVTEPYALMSADHCPIVVDFSFK